MPKTLTLRVMFGKKSNTGNQTTVYQFRSGFLGLKKML